MKALLVGTILFALQLNAQTFAPQIITNDCQSDPFNLHDLLDNGKIVVIGWAMPCSSCAAPLLDVHNAVLNFEISHPGKVEYWVVDDFANTDCVPLRNWALANGISNATFFSTTDIDMYAFGAYGMPKVVVVGCADHKIYYDANFTPTGQGVTDAVNQILDDQANSCLLGAKEINQDIFSIFPNPTTDKLHIELPEFAGSAVQIDVWNINGKRCLTASSTENQTTIDLKSLEDGIYLIRLTTGTDSWTHRFVKGK